MARSQSDVGEKIQKPPSLKGSIRRMAARSRDAALTDGRERPFEREDEVFFPTAMEYLDRSEQDAMLQEMWEFDGHMIHEKHRAVIERLERGGE